MTPQPMLLTPILAFEHPSETIPLLIPIHTPILPLLIALLGFIVIILVIRGPLRVDVVRTTLFPAALLSL